MKRKIQFIFTLLSIFYTVRTTAQNADNYVSINSTTSSFTAITTPTGVTTQQTKSAAFQLTIESRNNNSRIFVQGSSATIPISKLAVKLNSLGTNSTYVSSPNYSAVYLTGSTQQILAITSTGSKNKPITATFDLILDPIGWSIQGGSSYSFSLTITMTQP